MKEEAKKYLADKGIYGLDTEKRTDEVLEWMADFAERQNKEFVELLEKSNEWLSTSYIKEAQELSDKIQMALNPKRIMKETKKDIAHELMLENWVMIDDGVKLIERQIEHPYQFNEDNRRIPLTESWLEQFGFNKKVFDAEHNGYTAHIDHDTLHEYYIENSMSLHLRIEVKEGKSFYMRDVEFVHQLQNLYFCLTGKKLIRKI